MNDEAARWMSRLCCPACGAALEDAAEELACAARCGARLAMRDGVPVLLDVRRSVFLPEQVRSAADPMEKKSRRKNALELYERCSARRMTRLAELARPLAARPAILVIGGGQRGPGMDVLYGNASLDLLATDVYVGPCTRVVCDAHALPLRTASVDAVVIQAVLEHVLDPAQCVAEIHRVLRPGGLVFAETPFIQQVHMGAYDFSRWTPLGHRRLFRCFDEIETGVSAGPGYALAWTLTYFLTSFSEDERTRRVLAKIGGLLGQPLKRLDRFLMEKRGSLDGASGCSFLGRRRETAVPDAEIIASYRGLN